MIESFKIPSATFPTLTGNIVTFNSQYAGLPLKSHTVDIDYTGNPISNCFVVNMADDTNISYFQGLLNGTYDFVDLGSLKWALTEKYFRADLPILPKTVNDREEPNAITDSQYQPIDFYSLYNDHDSYDDVFSITNGATGNNKVFFRDTSYNDPTVFKSAVSGVYLIYELSTPKTPTITEAEFNTLLSAFNISGNTFQIPFDTPIYGGSYDCLTGIVTSNKDSSGGDITPSYQQTATANFETNLGVNNIWADTGDTTLQYPKFG